MACSSVSSRRSQIEGEEAGEITPGELKLLQNIPAQLSCAWCSYNEQMKWHSNRTISKYHVHLNDWGNKAGVTFPLI